MNKRESKKRDRQKNGEMSEKHTEAHKKSEVHYLFKELCNGQN